MKSCRNLRKRKGLIDALTITGGEPLIQTDLLNFVSKVKALNIAIKIDTNGSSPSILEEVISSGMIDYIAMDIKSTPEKYQEISGIDVFSQIQRSISLIMSSRLPYEFRTTVFPRFHDLSDFEEIGKMIKGSDNYFVQNFRPQTTLDPGLAQERSFTGRELMEIKKIMDKYVKNCQIRENA
jgi:pyruvate formate lyase activating enzyme